MYTREIQGPRPAPIENGVPLNGTWTQAFAEVDLLAIHRPYKLPIPRWLADFRIKEWESFTVQNDQFFLHALFSNLKFYRSAQVVLIDLETKELTQFKKFRPLTGWRLPRSLTNASVESRSGGFFFRIHDWLDAYSVRVDIDIEATKKRPSFTAHLTYGMEKKNVTPMAVSLLFSDSRSMYAYNAPAPVRGDMVFGGKHYTLDPGKTTGLFCDCKGYYPFIASSVWCSSVGFYPSSTDRAKKRIGFHIAENQARENFKNNENALWVDGKLTPLPPVRITVPNGPDADWVIQDLEGMVDLTFTPEKYVRSAADVLLTRAVYDSPLGYYNGMLVNSKGEEIPIRNMWGMGEKISLRV
jgi:hypothetical protein